MQRSARISKEDDMESKSENNELIIKLSKKYTFEGKDYMEIDLSGIQEFSGRDLTEIDQQWKTASKATFAVLQEFDRQWCFITAARATRLPVEFFYGLPGKECVKVCDAVTAYFRS